MSKLKKTARLETTFGTYILDELIGEGGAGHVYGGTGIDASPVAVKVLAPERASTDKRRRFQNEIAFLTRNKHLNIVSVVDHGLSHEGQIVGPFYVMPRYDGNMRDLMRGGIAPERVMPLFSQIMDGVEAAHLKGVVHRDLKPENVLFLKESNRLAIADFGTARFTEDLVAIVQTGPGQRLANFQYAAPEQRTPGSPITPASDIYALGLMLNELFTGAVPHGTEYRLVRQASSQWGYLDPIVAKMLRQSPADRPGSIADLKGLLLRQGAEAVSFQKLSQIDATVIKAAEIDEPLAETPPKLISADWDGARLTLTLDRPVTPQWISALQNMGSFTSVLGKGPNTFSFHGSLAFVDARDYQVQSLVDHFKQWLPMASRTLKSNLQQEAQRQEAATRERLRREREAEEQRLRVIRNIRI